MIETRFTKMYDVKHPLALAGMGMVALPDLVAAVCNAGGFGVLGAAVEPPEITRGNIQRVRELTDRPFGVNFINTQLAIGPGCTDAQIDLAIEERVPVVVFHKNLPAEDWVARLKSAGAKVWMTAENVPKAREAAARGADAVVVQGSEAGGHNASISGLFGLVPAVTDAIPETLVLAAGGIADARTAAAALVLGADAVVVGTRLLASVEGYAHDEYKRRITEAGHEDIVRTHLFGPEWPDEPMNVIANGVVREYAGRDDKTPAPPPGAGLIGKIKLDGQEVPMQKFCVFLPTPDAEGDFEEMCITAGTSAALVRDIRPAGELVREMMEGAAEILGSGRTGAKSAV